MDRKDNPLSVNFVLLMELATRGASFSGHLTTVLSGLLGFEVSNSVIGRSLRRMRDRSLIVEIEDPDLTDNPTTGLPRVVYEITSEGVECLYGQELFVRKVLKRGEEY